MEQNLFLALLFLNLITTGILIIRGAEGKASSNMGRTLLTSTQLIQEFEESWQPYARALRKEDREVLGELFAMVRFQSAAIAYASRPDPFQAFALAMLGGMMKRLIHLETVLERDPASFSEEQGESFPSPPLNPECGFRGGIFDVVDGHPGERDWQDASDWERDPDAQDS
jgi:hypothetical protein